MLANGTWGAAQGIAYERSLFMGVHDPRVKGDVRGLRAVTNGE